MDVSQAENYRDQLTAQLKTGTRMDIVLIGKARDPVLTDDNLAKGIVVHSFASIISAARSELDWILSSLSSEAVPAC